MSLAGMIRPSEKVPRMKISTVTSEPMMMALG
jgi:hypothetical protein